MSRRAVVVTLKSISEEADRAVCEAQSHVIAIEGSADRGCRLAAEVEIGPADLAAGPDMEGDEPPVGADRGGERLELVGIDPRHLLRGAERVMRLAADLAGDISGATTRTRNTMMPSTATMTIRPPTVITPFGDPVAIDTLARVSLLRRCARADLRAAISPLSESGVTPGRTVVSMKLSPRMRRRLPDRRVSSQREWGQRPDAAAPVASRPRDQWPARSPKASRS
jgi:hypothetical protein